MLGYFVGKNGQRLETPALSARLGGLLDGNLGRIVSAPTRRGNGGPVQPLILAQLARISRNSFGPLISLRLRSCRSSSVTDGSPSRSTSWPAIYAFAALLVRTCARRACASPSSTSWRIPQIASCASPLPIFRPQKRLWASAAPELSRCIADRAGGLSIFCVQLSVPSFSVYTKSVPRGR
jgi:hypothetical protein